MTRLTVKALTLITFLFVISSQAAQADVDLTDGIRAFVCKDEAVVLLETDNGWVLPTDTTAEVKPTDNGWRYEDVLNGDVWYLREESRNSWVIDGLSEDGHFKLDCIDLADSVSQVVTIIKPRLDEGIMDTQVQLAETKDELQVTKDELSRTQTRISEFQDELQVTKDELSRTQTRISEFQDELSRTQTRISEFQQLPSIEVYLLAVQRVERLCIWMKTYRHLDVLDKWQFPFDGAQYKLCK